MLVSRTADSGLNLENECTSCHFDLEVQDKQNWIPSGKMVPSSASEVAVSVQNEECAETPGVGALGLRIPHDVEGYAVEPESGGGRDGSRCTLRRYGSPRCQHLHQSLKSWWQRHRWTEQRSKCYIRRADVQTNGHSMNCLGCRSVMTNTTARAHTEECRTMLENCLAEDEETKFRSETAKLRVEGWLAS